MTTPATTAPMTIEVLYFDGCPNHEKLLTHLPQLPEREDITAEIVSRNIPDTDSAVKERFLGSPTVRLDGYDIDPRACQRDDYGLKCRIYHTPTGLSGLPPDQWILDAIAGYRTIHTHAPHGPVDDMSSTTEPSCGNVTDRRLLR